MLLKFLPAFAAACCLMVTGGAAKAQVIDEVSVGGYLHDVVNITDGVESNLQDLQLEVDTTRPNALRVLGAPRLNTFVTFNSAHKSDMAGAGLTWDHRLLFPRLFATLDFGLAYSDGVINPPPGHSNEYYDHYPRLLLGSNVLFRTAPGIEWHIDDHWVIGGQFIHLSNAGLLGSHHYNRGINDAGLRIGYRFC